MSYEQTKHKINKLWNDQERLEYYLDNNLISKVNPNWVNNIFKKYRFIDSEVNIEDSGEDLDEPLDEIIFI